MAIIKTDKISLYVMDNELSEVMDFLQKKSVIELLGEVSVDKDRGFSLAKADKALEIISRKATKKRLNFKKMSVTEKEDRGTVRSAEAAVEKIIDADIKINKCREQIKELEKRTDSLMPYAGLDCPMETETDCCRVITGECTIKGVEELQKNGVCTEIIKSEKRRVLVWLAYLKVTEISELFKKSGFVKGEPSLKAWSPKEEIERLKKQKEELLQDIKALEKELEGLCEKRKEIELYRDRISVKTQKYHAMSQLKSTEKVHIITGYVSEKEVEGLVYELVQRFTVSAELEEPEEGEILPTAFENNAFVAPVEEITASYSMPARGDIDPNPITAVFYYWFFGMMFSDAGYGILMMLVCGIAGFSEVLDIQKRKSYRLFFWCGVSTTLWGIAYGSFFGDLIGAVSSTFGSGKTAFMPLLLDPVNQALQLLILSAAFGIIHLVTALSIKFYGLWKEGDKVGAVCDVGIWITALIGVSILALGAFIKQDVIIKIGIYIAVLSATGLVATGGRDKKNPIVKLFAGVMKLYDITGYVGDILSYSRLMALGLATGVIASVVNVLASLGGNSPLGAVVFVLVAVLGHTMNLAINMLGAYVHTNRLQYVEFFQKFYQGGGRRFKPFKKETKYFELD